MPEHVKGRIERDGPVHWLSLRGRTRFGWQDGETDCGVKPAIVWNVAEAEEVTCAACLAANRDGLDALFHEIDQFLQVRQAVPA